MIQKFILPILYLSQKTYSTIFNTVSTGSNVDTKGSNTNDPYFGANPEDYEDEYDSLNLDLRAGQQSGAGSTSYYDYSYTPHTSNEYSEYSYANHDANDVNEAWGWVQKTSTTPAPATTPTPSFRTNNFGQYFQNQMKQFYENLLNKQKQWSQSSAAINLLWFGIFFIFTKI